VIDPLQANRQDLAKQAHAPAGIRPAQPTPSPKDQISLDSDELIELVDEPVAGKTSGGSLSGSMSGTASAAAPARKIVAFGGDEKKLSENFKRQPIKTGNGACRVKSFHGKYSDEGLRYLDHAINVWLDEHPEVEVKFVTSTVMTFEGKTREPALVLNCWY
jgi:hypothetical protein